jgi:hypothetical protein
VRRISAATAFAVVFGSVALTVSGAAPAMADSTAVLPVESTGKIVVDSIHQRVFVSDRLGGEVLATDYSGKVLGTIGSLTSVLELALSPDSGTLYAASPGLDAIVAVDTTTLQETARYVLDVAGGPSYLAVAGGKLWFGYGSYGDSNLGSVDLSAAEPTVTLGLSSGWYFPPHLDSDPAQPNMLAAIGLDSAGIEFRMAVYDVSSGTPVRTGERYSDTNGTDNGAPFARHRPEPRRQPRHGGRLAELRHRRHHDLPIRLRNRPRHRRHPFRRHRYHEHHRKQRGRLPAGSHHSPAVVLHRRQPHA